MVTIQLLSRPPSNDTISMIYYYNWDKYDVTVIVQFICNCTSYLPHGSSLILFPCVKPNRQGSAEIFILEEMETAIIQLLDSKRGKSILQSSTTQRDMFIRLFDRKWQGYMSSKLMETNNNFSSILRPYKRTCNFYFVIYTSSMLCSL